MYIENINSNIFVKILENKIQEDWILKFKRNVECRRKFNFEQYYVQITSNKIIKRKFADCNKIITRSIVMTLVDVQGM